MAVNPLEANYIVYDLKYTGDVIYSRMVAILFRSSRLVPFNTAVIRIIPNTGRCS